MSFYPFEKTNRVISRICECLLDQEGLEDPHLYRSVMQITAVLNQCVLGNGTERGRPGLVFLLRKTYQNFR